MKFRWLPLSLWFCVSACAFTCHESFRVELGKKALYYFLDHAHPDSGLVRDRARNFEPTPDQPNYRAASIAATGFGLAVIANASRHNLLSKADAVERVGKTLRFARDHLARYQGWFYHFVTWDKGERVSESEVSTVDTSIFIAGALYAAYALDSSALIDLAEELHRDINYIDMMTDGGTRPHKRTLSMGWTPEKGYLPWQWERYTEHLVLIVLGLGHSKYPLPLSAWHTWKKREAQLLGPELPLFVHQYSHLFIDFRKIATPTTDLFRNSKRATLLNRAACRAMTKKYLTYREGFWGLSASDSPTGYQAFSPAFHDGTVCPGCVGGSAMFLPCPILGQMKAWALGTHRVKIWGEYGFSDSLNLDAHWFDPDVIGITVGALYLSLANTRTPTSVWRRFHSVPAIRKGLLRIKGNRRR